MQQLTIRTNPNSADSGKQTLDFKLQDNVDNILLRAASRVTGWWNLLFVHNNGYLELNVAVPEQLHLPLKGTDHYNNQRVVIQEEKGCN